MQKDGEKINNFSIRSNLLLFASDSQTSSHKTTKGFYPDISKYMKISIYSFLSYIQLVKFHFVSTVLN